MYLSSTSSLRSLASALGVFIKSRYTNNKKIEKLISSIHHLGILLDFWK